MAKIANKESIAEEILNILRNQKVRNGIFTGDKEVYVTKLLYTDLSAAYDYDLKFEALEHLAEMGYITYDGNSKITSLTDKGIESL